MTNIEHADRDDIERERAIPETTIPPDVSEANDGLDNPEDLEDLDADEDEDDRNGVL